MVLNTCRPRFGFISLSWDASSVSKELSRVIFMFSFLFNNSILKGITLKFYVHLESSHLPYYYSMKLFSFRWTKFQQYETIWYCTARFGTKLFHIGNLSYRRLSHTQITKEESSFLNIHAFEPLCQYKFMFCMLAKV